MNTNIQSGRQMRPSFFFRWTVPFIFLIGMKGAVVMGASFQSPIVHESVTGPRRDSIDTGALVFSNQQLIVYDKIGRILLLEPLPCGFPKLATAPRTKGSYYILVRSGHKVIRKNRVLVR